MRRRLLLGIALIAIGVIAALLAGELGATLFYVWQPGAYASPDARLAALHNTFIEEQQAGTCQWGDNLIVHPYLGYVASQFGSCGWTTANSKSLFGKEYPDQQTSRIAYILVAGGSVAAGFTGNNREQDSPLEAVLNRDFTGPRFDKFVVLNGGMGAWKQPQQSFLFALYADVLAGVIMLDGYNEHFMLLVPRRFEEPYEFFTMVQREDARAGLSILAEAAREFSARLFAFANQHAVFRYSNLAYFIVDQTTQRLHEFAERQSRENWQADSYEKMFAFQRPMSPDEVKSFGLAQYAKYIRLTHAGANTMGIPSLFLIQPSPAIQKPLTEREAPFASVTQKDLYQEMADYLTGLRANGVPVFSLLDVFKDTTEEVYSDAIHLNDTGRQIVTERVADLIESQWGWPRRKPPQP